jgi:hypothetical protein
MSKPNESANYGIIGNVKAKAVAVGPDAKAVVNETAAPSRADFDAALAALREQIAGLHLPEHSRDALHGEVEKIEHMADEKPDAKPAAHDVLKSIVEKFKLAGVFLQTAAGLQEPITKLAEWFHVSLPF